MAGQSLRTVVRQPHLDAMEVRSVTETSFNAEPSREGAALAGAAGSTSRQLQIHTSIRSAREGALNFAGLVRCAARVVRLRTIERQLPIVPHRGARRPKAEEGLGLPHGQGSWSVVTAPIL